MGTGLGLMAMADLLKAEGLLKSDQTALTTGNG